MKHVLSSLQEASDILNKFIAEEKNIKSIEDACLMFAKTYENGQKAISFGNGGSMCDAMHFAEELTGRFRDERRPLPAVSVSDPSHITCVANDYGFDHIFAKYVEAWAQKGDTILAISTSGNSPNVINAVKVAKSKGAKVVGLLGKSGGKLKNMVDIPIIIPAQTSDRVQEIHIKIIHILIEGIERHLFPENY